MFTLDVSRIAAYKFLFELQASGICNMFEGGAHLQRRFSFSKRDAEEILLDWMGNYDKIRNAIDDNNIEENEENNNDSDNNSDNIKDNSDTTHEDKPEIDQSTRKRNKFVEEARKSVRSADTRAVRSAFSNKNLKLQKLSQSDIDRIVGGLADHLKQRHLFANPNQNKGDKFVRTLRFLVEKRFADSSNCDVTEMRNLFCVYPHSYETLLKIVTRIKYYVP